MSLRLPVSVSMLGTGAVEITPLLLYLVSWQDNYTDCLDVVSFRFELRLPAVTCTCVRRYMAHRACGTKKPYVCCKWSLRRQGKSYAESQRPKAKVVAARSYLPLSVPLWMRQMSNTHANLTQTQPTPVFTMHPCMFLRYTQEGSTVPHTASRNRVRWGHQQVAREMDACVSR